MILLLIVLALDNKHVSITILADIPLAMVFAYCLFVAFEGYAYREVMGLISLVLATVMLVMTKQVGIAMLIVVILANVISGIFAKVSFKKISY